VVPSSPAQPPTRWDDVDLSTGVITVRAAWDDEAGEITPESRAGARTVPSPDSFAII
jgi:hypothetical protein